MAIRITKQDCIAAAAGIAVGLVAWIVFLPQLPVVCFFAGLMIFALTQKALRAKAPLPKPAGSPKPDGAP